MDLNLNSIDIFMKLSILDPDVSEKYEIDNFCSSKEDHCGEKSEGSKCQGNRFLIKIELRSNHLSAHVLDALHGLWAQHR